MIALINSFPIIYVYLNNIGDELYESEMYLPVVLATATMWCPISNKKWTPISLHFKQPTRNIVK